jgi:hypothetical protein
MCGLFTLSDGLSVTNTLLLIGHMTAYFIYADLPHLPTCDTDPILRQISAPSNFYRSGKARSRTSGDSDRSSPVSSKPAQYQPWPPSRPAFGVDLRRATTDAVPRARSGLSPVDTTISSPTSRPLSATRGPEDLRVIHLLNSKTTF